MVNKPPGCLIAFGLCLALSLGWIAPAGAYAQVLYGSITGNVADSTGARVPGAEVKIVNPDTNYTQSAVSNETGIYTIKNVPGGTYTLTVTMTGFKEYEAKNVSVTVGNVTRHDVALQIGQLSDTVSVTGAATTVITKSGTNDLHGSAFALHENGVTNARDFFFYGDKTPHSLRNIDGGTVGGRIIKDKLFFFAGFEATMERLGQSSQVTLPTDDQKAGNFSAYNTTIYDPTTNPRTAFPNNTIPSTRFSPAAVKMQALLPSPNLPGVVANYQATGIQDLNRYNTDTKIDWYRSQSHHVWGKFSYMN